MTAGAAKVTSLCSASVDVSSCGDVEEKQNWCSQVALNEFLVNSADYKLRFVDNAKKNEMLEETSNQCGQSFF